MPEALCTCGHAMNAHDNETNRCALCGCTDGPWYRCHGCGAEWDVPMDDGYCFFCPASVIKEHEPSFKTFDEVLAGYPEARQREIRATLAAQQEEMRRFLDDWTYNDIDGVTYAVHRRCNTAFIVPQEHVCVPNGGAARSREGGL
jgi:hypothetical protein